MTRRESEQRPVARRRTQRLNETAFRPWISLRPPRKNGQSSRPPQTASGPSPTAASASRVAQRPPGDLRFALVELTQRAEAARQTGGLRPTNARETREEDGRHEVDAGEAART